MPAISKAKLAMAAKTSAQSTDEGSGSANQSRPLAITATSVKAPTHGFRRPALSAIAPRIGPARARANAEALIA